MALELGLCSERDATWLRREMGISESQSQPPATEVRPQLEFDVERGLLRLNGEQLRRIRVQQNPSNIHRILTAFQEENWPPRIHDPLPGGRQPQRLHEAVYTLNKRLNSLRFHVEEAGSAIAWELI